MVQGPQHVGMCEQICPAADEKTVCLMDNLAQLTKAEGLVGPLACQHCGITSPDCSLLSADEEVSGESIA